MEKELYDETLQNVTAFIESGKTHHDINRRA